MIYLIHFDQQFKHAQHYIGYTSLTIPRRMERHYTNRGAKLLLAVNDAGINWHCVRVWDAERGFEKRLKSRKNASRLCPICNPSWRNTTPQYKNWRWNGNAV